MEHGVSWNQRSQSRDCITETCLQPHFWWSKLGLKISSNPNSQKDVTLHKFQFLASLANPDTCNIGAVFLAPSSWQYLSSDSSYADQSPWCFGLAPTYPAPEAFEASLLPRVSVLVGGVLAGEIVRPLENLSQGKYICICWEANRWENCRISLGDRDGWVFAPPIRCHQTLLKLLLEYKDLNNYLQAELFQGRGPNLIYCCISSLAQCVATKLVLDKHLLNE